MLYLFYWLLKFFGPQGWWPARTPFEVIVGAVLTQNTGWKNVERAIENLRSEGLLDPWGIRDLPLKELEELIMPAGFFRVKSERLKNLVDFLCSRYRGDIGKMRLNPGWLLREELLSVNGIGEETADSILLYALEKPFFVIDSYTRRILARSGIITGMERYTHIQSIFMNSLPADVELFKEFHALLVTLGKGYCKAGTPLCMDCPVRLRRGDGED